jgi:hypothetical protein
MSIAGRQTILKHVQPPLQVYAEPLLYMDIVMRMSQSMVKKVYVNEETGKIVMKFDPGSEAAKKLKELLSEVKQAHLYMHNILKYVRSVLRDGVINTDDAFYLWKLIHWIKPKLKKMEEIINYIDKKMGVAVEQHQIHLVFSSWI